LEDRNLLSGTSFEARLSIWVDSAEVTVPASIGVNSSGTNLSQVHTDGSDGTLVVEPIGSETLGDVTLGDFFDTWRTNAGVAGTNSNAVLSSTQLLANVADTTNTVQMFVNGEISTAFEDYVLQADDQIVLVYGSNPVVSLNTNFGPIVMELFKEDTPITVDNFLNYVNDGDYTNSIFHRSDPDFVIQGGGFTTSSEYFSSTSQFTEIDTDDAIENEPGISNLLGTVAMAKISGDADSATSQFFVNLGDNSFLDSEDYDSFTVFAQVLDMTTVDAIAALTVDTSNASPFGELPLGDDDKLVVVKSIAGQGTLTGTKFNDADGDGTHDSGEAGVSGIKVYIDANGNGAYDSGETYTTTDSDGNFLLQVEPGTYTVRAELSSGTSQTYPSSSAGHSVTVEIGSSTSGVDFGESTMSAPSGVDLVSTSDSGTSSTDNITRFNNSSSDRKLEFLVSGVLDGATVYLYCNGSVVASATASGTTATLTTDGATAFSDGTQTFTATQTVSGTSSNSSPSLSVTIDATAPAAIASTPSDTATIGVTYTFDADSPDEGESGLVYSLVDEPDGMTINSSTGVVSWTPTEDQAVPQLFSIVLTDAAGNTTSKTVDMTVYGTIPAEADSYTVTEDSTLSIDAESGVLANDGDDESGTLTAELIASPAHGTVSFNADGSFIYTPNSNFYGTDSFTYQATDGQSDTNVAKVTITVTNTNDSPTGSADSYTTSEDTTLTVTAANGVLANDSDPDDDTLTATLGTDASNGTLTLNSDGSFTYVPDANFTGTDTFTYILSDGSVTIDSVTVSLTVSAVNDAPAGAADSYSMSEDGTLTVTADDGVLANDSDPEGGSVTAVIGTQPANGTVSLSSDGSFTYTPDADFYGTDTFTYTASDGTNSSSAVTVTITVSGVADAPTATADAYTVAADSGVQAFSVLGNDSSAPDGSQTLTISAVTQGTAGGTVTINGTSIDYTPVEGFTGTDTFTYTITDTDGLTDTATVTVTVASANNSLRGYVYVDGDGDGVYDSTETGIPGVLITLSGTDSSGNSVSRTAITNAAGLYQFTGLPSGTYALTESQPTALSDGLDSTEVTDAVAGADTITNLVISGDTTGQCHFGETGLKASYISLRFFLASTPGIDEYLQELIAAAEAAAGNTDLADAIRNGETTLDNANSPVAVADSYSVDADTTLSIAAGSGVLANDSDADGDTLSAVLYSDPSHGTLTLNSDGSFSYVPTSGYTGTDSFSYRASDGSLTSGAVTVTIAVGTGDTTDNATPSVASDTYTATEDTTLTIDADSGVLDNDTDADGDTLTATVVSTTHYGTLTLNSDGSFSYVPNDDYSGTDSFTYTASDGTATSSTCTVTITVSSVNDAPTATADSYSVAENGVLTIDADSGVLINDDDVDGDTLSATLVTSTGHGSLTLNSDGSFTYTPNDGYSGSDTFVYTAGDGTLTSGSATVTITISGSNTAPAAVADSYTLSEDNALTIAADAGVLANDTDADDDPLTATLIADPAHGTVSLASDGSFTYTPDEDYSGTDSFTYQASDGSLASSTTTVTLTITAVADAPATTADVYRIAAGDDLTVDATLGVLYNDNDPDGDAITATLASNVSHGTLALASDGSFTYTPNEGFQGTDTFTYTATDGALTSTATTVTIYVNTLPVPAADDYAVDEDQVLTVDAGQGVLDNDSDADGDTLSAALATEPSNGTVTLSSDGSFVYTPEADFNGTDTFTYTVNDGYETSDEVLVTITVNAASDAPLGVADSYRTPVDTALEVTTSQGVLANDTDADNDALSATLVSSTTHGTLTFNADGSFTYTPEASYHGLDAFTYTASDGTLTSATTTVSIAVNTQATADDETYEVSEDGTLAVDAAAGVLTGDTDGDADPLTAVLVSGVSHGTLTLNADGSFSYTPTGNYNGTDSFTYAAHDGIENSATATVTITITAVNDVPVAADDSYSVTADNTLTVEAASGVLANDTDADGESLAATLVETPSHGVVTLNSNGSFTYTPESGYQGTDRFTYTAGDGSAASNVATVTVTVSNGLTAVADAYSMNEDGVLTVEADSGVLANDLDPEGATLTMTVVSTTAHGTLTYATDGTFTYIPQTDFHGIDTFTYTASDGMNTSAETTVTITVEPKNDAPVASNDSYRTATGATLTVSSADEGVLANDTDVDGDGLTVTVVVTNPEHGTLTVELDGTFSYTPEAGYQGLDTFSYTVTDGELTSNAATVTIEINSRAVAVNDAYTMAEDGTLTADAAGGVLANDTDADGDLLSASVVAQPAHGTLVLQSDGSFTYAPAEDYAGTDTFTYLVNDEYGASPAATVTITIEAANDAPTASDDTYRVDGTEALVVAAADGLLANDVDPDGDTLAVTVVVSPQHGTLELAADGGFTYTPDAEFPGSDSFTYTVSDGTETSDEATVTVTTASESLSAALADAVLASDTDWLG
jgi:VCBS repeat-containing protein